MERIPTNLSGEFTAAILSKVNGDAPTLHAYSLVCKLWFTFAEQASYYRDRCEAAGINERVKGARSWRDALLYFSIRMHLEWRDFWSYPLDACPEMTTVLHGPSADYQIGISGDSFVCLEFSSRAQQLQRWSYQAPEKSRASDIAIEGSQVFLLAAQGGRFLQAAVWDAKSPENGPEAGGAVELFPTKWTSPPERIEGTGRIYAVRAGFTKDKGREFLEYAFGTFAGSELNPPAGRISGDEVKLAAVYDQANETRLIFEVKREGSRYLQWVDPLADPVITQADSASPRKDLRANAHCRHALSTDQTLLFSCVCSKIKPGYIRVEFIVSDARSGKTITARSVSSGARKTTTSAMTPFNCSGRPAFYYRHESGQMIAFFENSDLHFVRYTEKGQTEVHKPSLGLFRIEDNSREGEESVRLVRIVRDTEGIAVQEIGQMHPAITGSIQLHPVAFERGEGVVALGYTDQLISYEPLGE